MLWLNGFVAEISYVALMEEFDESEFLESSFTACNACNANKTRHWKKCREDLLAFQHCGGGRGVADFG